MNNKKDIMDIGKWYKILISIYTLFSCILIISLIRLVSIDKVSLIISIIFLIPAIIMCFLSTLAQKFKWNHTINRCVYIIMSILYSLFFMYGVIFLVIISLFTSELSKL